MRRTTSAADTGSGRSSRRLSGAGWLADLRGACSAGLVARLAQLAEAARYRRRDPPAQAACRRWQLAHAPPARAAPRLRLRRRGPLPRLVRPPRAALPPAGSGGSPRRSGAPTRSSPATTSWPTAPSAPGPAAERVRVIPTCVDPDRYPPPRPAGAGDAAGHVDLVWIGSSSTLQGLERQRPLWERLGARGPGRPAPGDLRPVPRLRAACRSSPSPGARRPRPRELAAGDVGISWVPDDLWSRGKCGLKVLQYQAAGLPVVANPVGRPRRDDRAGRDRVPGRPRTRVGRGGPDAGRPTPRGGGGWDAAARSRVESRLLGRGLGRDVRRRGRPAVDRRRAPDARTVAEAGRGRSPTRTPCGFADASSHEPEPPAMSGLGSATPGAGLIRTCS